MPWGQKHPSEQGRLLHCWVVLLSSLICVWQRWPHGWYVRPPEHMTAVRLTWHWKQAPGFQGWESLFLVVITYDKSGCFSSDLAGSTWRTLRQSSQQQCTGTHNRHPYHSCTHPWGNPCRTCSLTTPAFRHDTLERWVLHLWWNTCLSPTHTCWGRAINTRENSFLYTILLLNMIAWLAKSAV